MILLNNQWKLIWILEASFFAPLHPLFDWVMVLEKESLVHYLYDWRMFHYVALLFTQIIFILTRYPKILCISRSILCRIRLLLLHVRYSHKRSILYVLLSGWVLSLQRHLLTLLLLTCTCHHIGHFRSLLITLIFVHYFLFIFYKKFNQFVQIREKS